MIDQLVQTLSAVGKPTDVYESPDGSKVLILPHGGRILGLFSPQRDENFLWNHTALNSVETARAFYESGEWQNSGGDRTWLSPEADIFFPNFPALDKYFQPRQLDPGNYKLEPTPEGLKLVNELRITLSRNKHEVDLRMTKSVSPAPNPLRYERASSNVEYAGYTLRVSLELRGASANSTDRVGLWNLLQLPHGGDLWVCTYSKSEPKIYMGSISKDDLEARGDVIRYSMRATGEHKIGIRAVATTGRAGYLYHTGNQTALVVRNFAVNPSGEYVDVPWTDTQDFGYSTQACNVNSHLGAFSELEYHAPAIGHGTGRTHCVDESQVWAFRGDSAKIRHIAQTLLSPTI